jgi:hypothetical protein
MRQDEVGRPALERAAEAVSDAQRASGRVRSNIIGMIARGDMQKNKLPAIDEWLREVDANLSRALSAIGEAAS